MIDIYCRMIARAIWLPAWMLACAALAYGQGPAPLINTGGVVDAANYRAVVSRGGIGSIFGVNLAGTVAVAAASPLPFELAGVSVEVNSVSAPLFFVSPQQINFQTPFESITGAAVSVVVIRDGAASNLATVGVADYAPALFINPATGEPIVQRSATGALITGLNPALPGDVLTIFLTGIGNLINQPASGAAAPMEPLATSTVVPTVTVAGTAAEVLFSGLAPEFVGLGQINIRMPASLAPGSALRTGGGVVPQLFDLALVVDFAGRSSAPVSLPVRVPQAPGAIGVTPLAVDFGEVVVGQSSTRRLTIENGGDGPLMVTQISLEGEPFSATLPELPLEIAAGREAEVLVSFSPTRGGRGFATLTIRSSDPLNPSVAVTLAGDGATQPANAPNLSLQGVELDFGEITLGSSGISFLTVTNSGTATLRIDDLRALSSTQFSIGPPLAPISVAPGGAVNLNLQFRPVLVGPATGRLRIVSNDGDTPVAHLTLRGAGVSEVSTDLPNGMPVAFKLPAVNQPRLFFSDFTVVVPAFAQRLEITLRSVTALVNLDLYLRYESDVFLNGEFVEADFSSTRDGGVESIVVTPLSGPPLQAGRYHIGVILRTTGTPVDAEISATVTEGTPPPPQTP